MSDLYETDIVLWSERQAELLRRRSAGELVNEADLDWPNIAEEIESLGKSLGRELASRVRTVLEHLAKLETSPAHEPRAGWRQTVLRARSEIEDVLEEGPSLRPKLDAMIARQMDRVRPLVAQALADHDEAPRVPLKGIQYTVEQVLGDWFPDT
jgi:hypothetical protein